MNEENVKIAKIKKSCGVGKTVCNILFVVCIVCFVIALVGGISIHSMGKKFDTAIAQAEEAGYVTKGHDIGNASWINLNIDDVTSFHSDIPQVQAAIDDHPYCVLYSMYCLIGAVVIAVTGAMLKLISSVFDLIIKENTPFTDKVIKRVTIVLIVLSAILLMTANAGLGVLGGIVTWVVYAILDYGKTLQIQSDETL